MKANEAPEKIYLEKVYPDNGVLPNGLNYNQSPDDIEYTRTDAFIEKARKWFEQQPETYDANGVRCYGMEDFEDFRKAMKGE